MIKRLEIINMPDKITNLDTDYIIREYASGVGVGGIADKLGVSPRPIERVIRENGVVLRGRGAQQQARMDKATPAEKRALVRNANIAARGSVRTFATKCKLAKSLAGRVDVHHVSALEDAFAEMLDDANVTCTRQVACGPYLCDFVIDSIAVEIWGGNYHFSGLHIARAPERFKYILDTMKAAIIITVNNTNPLTPRLIKALVANIDELSRHPTLSGEYRMLWSNGDYVTGNCLDGDNFTFKYPFANSRNTRSGRYERA